MARNFSNWIEAFYEYTDMLPSPTLFRKWAGIAIIAGALERKVWVRTLGSSLYPNMYTILVGPPGVGKTVLTSRIWNFWAALADGPDAHFIASTSIMKAGLIDDLRDAERKIVRPQDNPPVTVFNSLKICSNELSVLLPGYDADFMGTLTDLYDGHVYKERRRTRDLNFKIDAPQINLIAATTPSYLTGVLPEGAWDQGFLSRTLLIFSSEVIRRPLFEDVTLSDRMEKDLINDLKTIGKMYGKMTFTEEAAKILGDWHLAGGPPIPEHPKLMHYNTRRTAHILKLTMVACAASSDDLVITLEHVQTAMNWLVEAEGLMPDIFKSMSSGGDSRIIEDTWYFVYQLYLKENRPIGEGRIIHFLQERAPAHSVFRILEVMTRAGILQKKGAAYLPQPPKGA